MAYRYKLTQSLSEGTRRIATEQIALAKGDLRGDDDLQAGVFRARKNIKRLRALLRLTRQGMSDRFYTKQERQLRRLARRLGKARDIHAMLETLSRLEQRYSVFDDRKGLKKIRAELERRREFAEGRLTGGVLAGAVKELTRVHHRFQNLSLDGRGFDLVAEGLRDTYSDGRHRMRVADRRRTSEDFHEFRKAVQYHWRHMQLLNEAWRDDGDARVAAARELSAVLGDDHDIAILVGYVSGQLEDLISRGDQKTFVKLCRSAQSELRAHARPLGRRLYAEKPDAFVARMSIYWTTARDLQAMNLTTNPVRAEAQILAIRGKR